MTLAEMLKMADQATQGVEIASTEFKLLTPGNYDVAVTGCEGPIKSERTNPTNPEEHGQYLKIECTVTGPTDNGRKIWMNNNIICYPRSLSQDDVRKCQTAMAIGAKERKVMLDSIGKAGISDASELVGATFTASVIVEKGTNGYKDKNAIKSIRPISGFAQEVKQTTSQSSTSQQHDDKAQSNQSRPKMPWEK